MRKTALLGVALSALLLTACSTKGATTMTKTESKFVQTAKSDTAELTYTKIADELKAALDPSNSGTVKVSIVKDVTSSEVPAKHIELRVITMGDESTSNAQALFDAQYNSPTDEQKLAIQAIRATVSTSAKELPNANDAILFMIPTSSPDNTNLLAESTKDKDIIPLTVD